MFERDHQAVSEERYEDVGFDARFELVMDGADREVVLQFLERLLDFDELQIEPPEMAGVVAFDVGTQKIAALAPPRRAELLAIELEMEGFWRDRLVLLRRMDGQ